MSDLIGFRDFADRLPDVRRRTIERMAARRQFPPYVRLTPYAEPLWDRAAVEAWIKSKLSQLSTPTDEAK
jgi:predicted DNA-binding transcriptional regulator AlpA